MEISSLRNIYKILQQKNPMNNPIFIFANFFLIIRIHENKEKVRFKQVFLSKNISGKFANKVERILLH